MDAERKDEQDVETIEMRSGLWDVLSTLIPQLPASAINAPIGAVAEMLRDIQSARRVGSS